MGRDDEGTPTTSALEVVLERAETTIEYQLETVSEIEDRAIRIYRANLVLASLLLAGLSIAAETGGSAGRFLDLNIFAGMGLLVLGSTAVAATILDNSGLFAGIDLDDVDTAVRDGYDKHQSLSMLLSRYQRQLEFNDEALERKAWLLYLSIIVGFNGLVYVGVGVVDAFVVPLEIPFTYAILLSLCALPIAVFIAKVLSFPVHSGVRYLMWTGAVLAVPILMTVLQGRVFRGFVEFVWLPIPLYFLALSLVELATGRLGFAGYFLALLGLTVLTTVLGVLFPSRLVALLAVTEGVELSLFALVSSVLLVVDYRIALGYSG